MARDYHRLLFVFVDGVGLAPASADNPLSTEAMPVTARLLGGPLTVEQCRAEPELLLVPLDARLGVAGLPQSATGQTTLLTGVNGSERLGRHQTAIPGATLRALLERESVFLKLAARGLAATFANAYSPAYLARLAEGRGRASATTVAVTAAGVRLRALDDLERGAAVTWDIERDLFARLGSVELPPIAAPRAGGQLAALAARHDFTLYETFLTDLAGHRRWGVTPAEALRRVDALLGGVLDARPPGLTVLLTSDHGNVEDATGRGHTLNPVPLLVVGPLAPRFANLRSIAEVAPRIVETLARADAAPLAAGVPT